MDRDQSSQNVVLIRNAEDPDDYANYGESGYTVPPLGTYPTGSTTDTADNSSTAANNTPAEPQFEIVKGKATLNFPDDDDNKEAPDFSSREIEHDPGKEKHEMTMEMFELMGSKRYGATRRFHPTRKSYKPHNKHTRYELLIVSFPKDSSGVLIPVTPELVKTLIGQAEGVQYYRDVTFHNKSHVLEAGDKVKSSLAMNAQTKEEFNEYEFDAELKASGTIDTTPASLDTQPFIPTRIKLIVTVETAAGDVLFVGTNCRGEAITDTITVSGIGSYYTTKVFGSVDALGIQGQGAVDLTASIEADEMR